MIHDEVAELSEAVIVSAMYGIASFTGSWIPPVDELGMSVNCLYG